MKILLDTLLILTPLFFILMPICMILAVNQLTHIYINPNKAGFDIKIRTWGPTYSETKKILELTTDTKTKKSAKLSINLWKVGFLFGIIFMTSYMLILIISIYK